MAAIAARSAGFFDRVFSDGTVVLQGEDPWIHYRYIQALTRDLDQPLTHDPYLILPARATVPVAPLMDTSLALIVRALFGSDATDRQVGLVCAWMPPVVGGLTVILVYLIGVRLGGRAAGLTAAGVLALGPSLFFYNSRLGMADHHVLEVFFTTLNALLLLSALAVSRRHAEPCEASTKMPRAAASEILRCAQNDNAGTSWRGAVAGSRGSIGWSIIAGVVLLLYLWTWLGGAYWVFIFNCWTAAQYCIRHLRGETTGDLTYALLPGMLLAAVLLTAFPASYSLRGLQISAMWSAAALIVLMQALSWAFARRGGRRVWFPLTLLALAAAGLAASSMTNLKLLRQIGWVASLLSPGDEARTVEEVLPIFLQDGAFSLQPLWSIFGTTFPMALIGLLVVMVRVSRRGQAGATFLLVWSLVNFVAMCGQRRFAYYASVNVALLAGILVQQILAWSPTRFPASEGLARGHKGSAARRGQRNVLTGWAQPFAVAWVLILIFAPGLATLPERATEFDGPSRGWVAALHWVREQTPEPLGDPAAYYVPDRMESREAAADDQSYCIMSSWDCGYWITAIAHRIPCSNPTQAGAAREGRFFTSRDESEAGDILREAKARYVVLDSAMVAEPLSRRPDLSSKFYAMAAWADRPLSEYYERFEFTSAGGEARSMHLFYPAYFESMAVRLYAFGGQAVEPSRILVVRYEEASGADGKTVKRVISTTPCSSPDEAMGEMQQRSRGIPVLVSDHPLMSCAPLPGLSAFRPVYDTRWTARFPDGSLRPEVRVFEFGGK